MLVLELDGIEVDRCDRCGGVWLDSGELALLLEDGRVLETALGTAPPPMKDARHPGRCPRCRGRLAATDVVAVTGVYRCRRGHGLWCEAGALARLRDWPARVSPLVRLLEDVCPVARET